MNHSRTLLICLFLLSTLPLETSAQIADPCRYWPLCENSQWITTDDVWTRAGTRDVNGRTGTVIQYQDGDDEVYLCDAAGFQALQYSFPDEDCGRVIVTFENPVPLVAPGDSPGTARNLDSGADVACGGFGSLPATVTGTVSLVDFYEEFSVGMGTFADVAQIWLRASVDFAGNSLSTDTMYWLARDIGPILSVDQTTGTGEELTGGTVCGVAISPTGGGTPTPTLAPTPTAPPTPEATPPPASLAADLNRDGRVDETDLLLLLRRWHSSSGQ